jgi:hypothetical protein
MFRNAAGTWFGIGSQANTPWWVDITVSQKSLSLITSANPLTYSQAGQQITYTYVIKNSGNTNLGPAQFTISNSLIGIGSGAPINCGAADVILSPNAIVTCTAIYIITKNDIDKYSITNSATASGGGAWSSQVASITIVNIFKQ